MYLLIAFAEKYEERCPRGCCCDSSEEAKFEITKCDSYDELMKVMMNFAHPDRYVEMYIARSFEDFDSIDRYEDREGITVLGDYDNEEREKLEDQIRSDYIKAFDKKHLAELAAKAKKEEEDRLKREKEQEERERKQLAELKKKYEKPVLPPIETAILSPDPEKMKDCIVRI